jgi:ABC-type sugar transport system ATPase subunit
MDPIMSARGISKYFGAVSALEDVDFNTKRNEITGLVGDNGAGKSTLIKVLSGVFEPNAGEIYFENQRVSFGSPEESRKLGIEVIYQDMALVDELEIWENIFLGKLLRKKFLSALLNIIDKGSMKTESEKLLKRIGISALPSESKVGFLSGGQKKSVAIARSIYWNAKVIFMDEPTAALGIGEVRKVLDLIRSLKETGVSIVFISHNLQEIFSTVDRIVVLHKGKIAGIRNVKETNQDEIIKLIMGEGLGNNRINL